MTWAEAKPLWVADGSHKFLDIPKNVIDQAMDTLTLRKVIIQPFSVLFGHGQLTHAGAASHDLGRARMRARVYRYLITVGVVLRNNVSFHIVSPENVTKLMVYEKNPLPNPPLHIEPDALETEHRVV